MAVAAVVHVAAVAVVHGAVVAVVHVAAAAVAPAAVAVAVTSTVLYGRALQAERTAEQRRAQVQIEADKALRTQRFLQSMLGSLDPAMRVGRDTGLLHQILDDAAERVETEFAWPVVARRYEELYRKHRAGAGREAQT